ncbi:hypothetical protein AKJ16_DCAP02589 [Drosera capensis]
MVEKARRTAHFRVVILDGKVYVEKYRKAIQTRDLFTLWGIVQLVRLYPGRLPDLEMMFDCDDRPVVGSKDFRHPNAGPPPLFRYCSDWQSLDIVFPDWSFWGWEDLLKCNVSQTADWNAHAHLYIQDWNQEAKQALLAYQGQRQVQISQVLEWGNNHTTQAQAIDEAERTVHEDLKMEYVYDYMFHLLNENFKLLRFKPVIPQGAVEVCSETMVCQAEGIWRKMMIDSSVRSLAESPPAHGPPAVEANWERYGNLLRQVEMWEDQYGAQVTEKH